VSPLATTKKPTAVQGEEKSHSTGDRLASQWSMHAWLIRPPGTLPKHGGIDVPMNTAPSAATTV